MIIYIEDLQGNKKALLEEAKREINSYFENKEYLNSNLDLMISSKEETDEEMYADEYLHYAFSFWGELYKAVPEFLLFVEGNVFMEICLAFDSITRANAKELTDYSYTKAVERGIEEKDIENRFDLYYNTYCSV